MLWPKGVSKLGRRLSGDRIYPNRHGLSVQYLLRNVILDSGFPLHDWTPGATNWEHEGISVHVAGSVRVKLPIDIFSQARDAVRVLPRAWEAEAKCQLSRRICSQGGRNGRVRNLERFKADVTHRVGVRFGILWSGGNRSGERQVK